MQYPVKETFSIQSTDQEFISSRKKFLSIELSLDGFSYCILDTDKFRYVVLEAYELENIHDHEKLTSILEDFVRQKKSLNVEYQRVSISYVNPVVTFVPAELFAYSEKQVYLEFTQNVNKNSEIRVDKLHNLAGYAIYSFPNVLLNKINYLFPGCRLRHFSSSLIENLVYLVRYGRLHPQLILHVQKTHFEILIFDNENLAFFNSFRYQTWDDLFYYLFFVLEQMGLQAEDLDAMLVGEINIASEFYKKLKLYVKSLNFGPRNDIYRYSDAFDDIPHHYFYNLLNLNACG